MFCGNSENPNTEKYITDIQYISNHFICKYMLCVLLTFSRMITHLTLALQATGKKSIGRYRPIIFPFLRHRLLVLTFIYIFPLRVFINLSICAKRPFPYPSNHYQIQTTSSNIEIHETSPAVRILVITYS